MTPPRILIVDDEIIIARELEVRLKGMGYEIPAIASSGAEAIRLAVEVQPDLVLMDIVLKGDMDGIEAAAEIRRRCHAPIIYVTAYTDQKTLERAKATEPFAYIVKPFSEREINANIEMALYKHRVESRLRRVEQWFVSAVDEIGDAVIAADHNGIITIFNPAAEAITDWRKEDAIGKHLKDVLRLVDRNTGHPIVLDDVPEGPVVCLASDTVLFDKSERSIPVDSTTCCVRDAEGNPTGIVSVFRDIQGQRHGALVALNSDISLAMTRSVTLKGMLQLCAESMVRNLHASLARIWTINSTGNMLLLQASAGTESDLEGPHGKVPLGKSKVGMIAQEKKPYLTNDVAKDPLTSDPAWIERTGMMAFAGYPLIVDDKLVGVMAMYSRHHFADNVLVALGSVADSIAVGIERKRLEEQIRQIQKMEVIGQLAGGIAHDFNNMLTIISGYCQILLNDKKSLDDDQHYIVSQIAAAGDRAASLTRQLLTFSRKQVLEPRVLDLNALVVDMEKMLRRLIGENISLSTSLNGSQARVVADQGQIEQVLMNLAVNAVDAMPNGGKLTIETREVDLDETFAQTHPTIEPGEYLMLAVSDTGCGMTQDVLTHIFEPFFTTKGPGKGTGLGLATVYGIVRQSGGQISVYSEIDIGTTFKIYLPRTDESGAISRGQVGPLSMPSGTETVLLVEDEHAVRALSRFILQECGYTVLEAGDGDEALQISADYTGTIDILVTDVVLPGTGGRNLAENLTGTRPEIKVLYMSGYTDDAVIRHGVLHADTAFLQKPFTPSALANKVREVLDHSYNAASSGAQELTS